MWFNNNLEKINNTFKDCYNYFRSLFEDCDMDEFGMDRFADGDFLYDDERFDTLFEDWATGATKLVLMPRDCDFVFKIPFNYDDYECEIFQNADEEDGWDYCEVETRLFEIAREEDVDKFFAPTYLVGHIDGYPIYVQQKACFDISFPNWKDADNETRKSIEYAKSSTGTDASRIRNDVLSVFLDYYGEDALYTFLMFCAENDINDIHDGNVASIDGRMVVIDYSGYNEGGGW